MALHPGYRWQWFDDKWQDHPDWISNAKEMVLGIWKTDYKARDLPCISSDRIRPQEVSTDKSKGKRPAYHDPFEDDESSKKRIMEEANEVRSVQIMEDEYEQWCRDTSQQLERCKDPFAYWHGLRNTYPRLSEMALDFLLVQPMSAECERLFSSSKQMVTDVRRNLESEMISMCQCLRSWYRSGIVQDVAAELLDLSDTDQVEEIGGQVIWEVPSWLQEPEDYYSEGVFGEDVDAVQGE